MRIKSKAEYRLLSYVRDNTGVGEDILKMINISSLKIGWGPEARKTYERVKNNLITINEKRCFLTEEGEKELKNYEKIHPLGRRGIVEHRHENERIKPVWVS